MFLVLVNYVKPLEQVDEYLSEHSAFLDRYYASKKLVFSGRRIPRVGGMFLVNSNDEAEVHRIIAEDPFHENGIAEYELIQFQPTKYDDQFAVFLQS